MPWCYASWEGVEAGERWLDLCWRRGRRRKCFGELASLRRRPPYCLVCRRRFATPHSLVKHKRLGQCSMRALKQMRAVKSKMAARLGEPRQPSPDASEEEVEIRLGGSSDEEAEEAELSLELPEPPGQQEPTRKTLHGQPQAAAASDQPDSGRLERRSSGGSGSSIATKPVAKLRCEKCRFSTTRPQGLVDHRKTSSGCTRHMVRSYAAELNGFPSEDSGGKLDVNQFRVCQACGLRLKIAKMLALHLQSRSACRSLCSLEKPQECPKCRITLPSGALLLRHLSSSFGCRLVLEGVLPRTQRRTKSAWPQSGHQVIKADQAGKSKKQGVSQEATETQDTRGSSASLASLRSAWACPSCGFAASHLAQRRRHLASSANCAHHRLAAYARELNGGASASGCAECGLAIVGARRLVLHLHSRSACRLVVAAEGLGDRCPACPSLSFAAPHRLRWHLTSRPACRDALRLPSQAPLSCAGCGLTLWSTTTLERHRQSRFGCQLVRDGVLQKSGNHRTRSVRVLSAKRLRPGASHSRQPSKSVHTCPDCHYEARDAERLKMHRRPGPKKKCEIMKLKAYLLTLTDENGSDCRVCGVASKSTDSLLVKGAELLRHLSSVACAARHLALAKALGPDEKQPGLIGCPFCSSAKEGRNELRKHLLSEGCQAALARAAREEESGLVKLVCDKCNAVFHRPELLQRHCESRFGCHLTESLGIEDKATVERISAPRQPSKAVLARTCPECHYAPKTAERLMVHRRPGLRDKCMDVKRKSYVLALTGNKQSYCEVCGSKSWDLVRHLSSLACAARHVALAKALGPVEEPPGPLACPFCSTAKEGRDGLRKHLLTEGCRAALTRAAREEEAGLARLACDKCAAAFFRPELLQRHSESRFGCELTASLGAAAKPPIDRTPAPSGHPPKSGLVRSLIKAAKPLQYNRPAVEQAKTESSKTTVQPPERSQAEEDVFAVVELELEEPLGLRMEGVDSQVDGSEQQRNPTEEPRAEQSFPSILYRASEAAEPSLSLPSYSVSSASLLGQSAAEARPNRDSVSVLGEAEPLGLADAWPGADDSLPEIVPELELLEDAPLLDTTGPEVSSRETLERDRAGSGQSATPEGAKGMPNQVGPEASAKLDTITASSAEALSRAGTVPRKDVFEMTLCSEPEEEDDLIDLLD